MFPGTKRLTTLPPSCPDCLEILGASTCWIHTGVSRPLMGQLYILLYIRRWEESTELMSLITTNYYYRLVTTKYYYSLVTTDYYYSLVTTNYYYSPKVQHRQLQNPSLDDLQSVQSTSPIVFCTTAYSRTRYFRGSKLPWRLETLLQRLPLYCIIVYACFCLKISAQSLLRYLIAKMFNVHLRQHVSRING